MSIEKNKQTNASDDIEQGFLRFIIDNEYYAFPISGVQEIIPVPRIIGVPEFPAYAKGIINVRGSVIPIIDTRLRFHMPEAAYTSRTCIVTINCKDTVVGFIVDTVDSVVQIRNSEIMPPPGLTTKRTEYINGVVKKNEDIIMLLDNERMLTDDMLDAVKDGLETMNNSN